jgi:hypothetical protein
MNYRKKYLHLKSLELEKSMFGQRVQHHIFTAYLDCSNTVRIAFNILSLLISL